MLYTKTVWKHDLENTPFEIWSEIDDKQNELRKIEIFRDGRSQGASEFICGLHTVLSFEPLPLVEEINLDPQFEARYVSKEKFEEVWAIWEKGLDDDKC